MLVYEQHGGYGIDQLQESKQLQKEFEPLRGVVSELTLDKLILEEST